jgi:hypothetical protein
MNLLCLAHIFALRSMLEKYLNFGFDYVKEDENEKKIYKSKYWLSIDY